MTDSEQQGSEQKTRGLMLGRFLIVAFMGAVVMSECLFAYFWLPSADEVAARVQEMAEKAHAAGKQKNSEDEEAMAIEIDLGSFTITNHRLASESTFRTDFHLWGTVLEGEKKEFAQLFDRNKNRFRNLAIEVIQNSKRTDLTDPGLGSIKRELLGKSNDLFGKPILHEILFAEYTFVEL